ncbi:MAG: YceI family protein [Ginsengibacter sp.]
MKKTIYFMVLCLSAHGIPRSCFAQEYLTKNGRVSFFSKATLENITADNNQVVSLLNTQTGDFKFYLLVNAFHFPKAMMEQHFNSDYMESDKYSSSAFKGTIAEINKIDITKDGSYNVSVSGSLELHGVTKTMTTTGTIIIKNGKLSAISVFKILLKDFNIKIPSVVINNISEQIEITVNCQYEKRATN